MMSRSITISGSATRESNVLVTEDTYQLMIYL